MRTTRFSPTLGTAGFSDEEKQLITELITQAEQEVRALLPTLPDVIEVTAMVIDRNVDIVGGVTGRADAPGKVLIEISSVFPSVTAGFGHRCLEDCNVEFCGTDDDCCFTK